MPRITLRAAFQIAARAKPISPNDRSDERFSPPVNHASAPARQPVMEAAPTQVAAIL